MRSINELLEEILNKIGISEKIHIDEIESSRIFLDKLNKYFYQNSNGYISEFHEYWKKNHETILNFKIDHEQALKIALKFDEIFSNKNKFSEIEISPSIDKRGISKNNIANVRFFTAIQDFKINIYKKGRDPFQEYKINPEWFNAEDIIKDDNIIFKFLNYLEATGSQGDKRAKWMKGAAKFLLENCDGEAYKIFELCNQDVLEVRNLLAGDLGIGFSRKKADMFIRDMLDWGVWETNKNLEYLNVASDANTMRVALRTGLLQPSIPLLASYLDIYGLQYGLTDDKTQEAWRYVWNLWKQLPDNSCPPAPASMDYLIYKSIGKKNCLKNARKCSKCIMDDICPESKRKLKSPKAISIKGMTGWDSGQTDEGGGGGIMS
ncbi:hypothetical protein [Clostridium grantii]|uniref:Uncharacterized protein n=1 Tax=Clostridium grantii DSM 8605 TaxID=1121316 RepID=A0A1M5VGV6_9CLOT|nr:hypothetical protein [Clostridium grantii]SHH74456.1 hypothetical protein SAMN02745207_02299 [Clostridium grantii DSM 8605]